MQPRTVSGQAVISGMRDHLKRAFGRTVIRIEDEAAAPYRAALERLAPSEPMRDADGACAWCHAPAGHAPDCAWMEARTLLARETERGAETGE
jgi:hypothetical protein